MNSTIEDDAMKIWEYMSLRKFDVYSPGEIARHVFGDGRVRNPDNAPNYRRAIRALNCLVLAKVVDNAHWFGNNQSCYWLVEQVK